MVDPKELLAEVNRFRRNPAQYVEEMQSELQFRQNVESEVHQRQASYTTATDAIVFPSGAMVETQEGMSSLESLEEDVKALGYDPDVTLFPFGLPELQFSSELSEACRDHVQDLCSNDFYSHIGTDGTTPEERIVKYGSFNYARFPQYHAEVDKIRAKTTNRRMNNTTNHRFRDRSQTTNVDSALLNAELKKFTGEISPPTSPAGAGNIDRSSSPGGHAHGGETGAEGGAAGAGGGSPSGGKGGQKGKKGSGTAGDAPSSVIKKAKEPKNTNTVPYQVAENIHFGLSTAKDVVYHFLLDDKDPHRGHRQNLLNRDFHHFGGAFSGKHPSALTCACVLLVDASFFPKKPPQVRLDLAQEYIGKPNVGYQDDTFYDVIPLLHEPPKAARGGANVLNSHGDEFLLDAPPSKAGFSHIVSGATSRRDSRPEIDGIKASDMHDMVTAHRRELLNSSQQVSKTNTITSSIVTSHEAGGDYSMKRKVETTTWQDVCDLVKPTQYKLSAKQEQQIPALIKPLKRFWRYIPPRDLYPKSFLGEVEKRHVAKSIVRAFCHHVSHKGEPRIRENELSETLERFNVYKLRPNYHPGLVKELFDEIIHRRPIELQKFRDISDQEVYDAICDKREWAPVINIVCFPEKSDKMQQPYELIGRTSVIDEWLLKLYDDFQSIGFFGGNTEVPNIFGHSSTKENYKVPGYYRAFGEELVRFMKRSPDFRSEVLSFLQKPGATTGGSSTSINKNNEDVVEQMHEIKFHNPRKLWVFSRRPNADIWLDMMKLLDHNPVNQEAHKRNDHFFNGHLLDIQGEPVPKQNHAKMDNKEVTRSKVFQNERSDAWIQNKPAMGLLGGTYLQTMTGQLATLPGVGLTRDVYREPIDEKISDSLKVVVEPQNSIQIKEVKIKPLATVHSLRPTEQYPGVNAIEEGRLETGPEEKPKPLSELEQLSHQNANYVNETIGASSSSSSSAGGPQQLQQSRSAQGGLRFTLDGSKRTFRRAMAKTERVSFNRNQLQQVLVNTAAMTGHYDQTLSTWRNRKTTTSVSPEKSKSSVGANINGATLYYAEPPGGSFEEDSDAALNMLQQEPADQHQIEPALLIQHQPGGTSQNSSPSWRSKSSGIKYPPTVVAGSIKGPDNVDPEVRDQLYGPILNTNDSVCQPEDKIPLTNTGDSIPVIGSGGVRLLRPAKFSLAQTLSEAYKGTILTSKSKAITYGKCAIEHPPAGSGNSSSSSSSMLQRHAYSTLNLNAVQPTAKQMCVHTWYNNLPCAGDSTVTQIGAMPLHLASGIDAKTKVNAVRFNDKECGNIDHYAANIPSRNNYVDTSFSSVKHPYNNHGIFYHNVNNKTSNTISGTYLELNAQRLSKKQTKSTLSLDQEELYRYVATDQGPVTNAVNHADLGAHLDHSKYVPRGADYDKIARLSVDHRFDGQFLARNKEMCPTPQDAKKAACRGTRSVSGPYKPWKPHVFRADEPERNGRFGPRKFNAENLGARPLALPISGIDTLPNPDRITNFLNIEKTDAKEANTIVTQIRPNLPTNSVGM
ncbi:unnamed protein product [Amoebophrya sp. A120]|nr:unnamed protein product [Amoebophrya sp. A120]|eukprot:GSA120T00024790001.1